MSNTCPNCGNENKEGDKFCGECGSALDAPTEVSKLEMGGYLVCSSCGGFYKLQEGESPFDFESCECGGKLKYTNDPTKLSSQSKSKSTSHEKVAESVKTLKNEANGRFSQVSKKRKAIIGLAGICVIGLVLILAIGVIPISSGKVFENEYIKFQIPDGVNVTDKTENNSVNVELNKGSEKKIITISTKPGTDNIFKYANDVPNSKKTTVAGKEALEITEGTGIKLIIRGADQYEVNKLTYIIEFEIDSSEKYSSEYNTVKNSLVIKKTPSPT